MRFEVSTLRDSKIRNMFKLTLHNRFQCETLQQLIEEEELPVEDDWSQIDQEYGRPV